MRSRPTPHESRRGRRPASRAAALLTAGLIAVGALALGAPEAASAAPAAATGGAALGPNVTVFSPTTPQATIQAKLDAIAKQQVPNQFGTARKAVYFLPGTYGSAAAPLVFQVGYYTEIAGLGQSPADVVINGEANVYNQCDATGSCIALNNFWRSMSNLTIHPMGGDGCRTNTEFWAVSQASPLRRVDVEGGPLTFMDYCTAGPQYASGGFMADSKAGAITNGSQQQFYTRDSSIGTWSNGVWNQVFSGVEGAPAQSFPTPQPYTTLATTPASREKPYLSVDGKGRYRVFVPSAETKSSGTTWSGHATPGRSLPIGDFYVARVGDSAATIQRHLDRGEDLLLTPGVYGIDRGLRITHRDTVVLGLGIATLTAQRGVVPITVGDVKGVDIAGIMIDAGATNSPALLRIGTGGSRAGSAADPTGIQDVFFRIGGPHVGRATDSLVVNSDHVILDDIWAWRADHGTGVGWTVNTAKHGVVVNGDDVTATGLFVEHFQQYNVIWNGERGTTVFFQNELPYDAPNQAAWRHGKVLGWAAYKVANSVQHHELWGGGSYIFTNVDPTLHATRGFEVPITKGVRLHDLLTVNLAAGTLDHVVNDTGAAATTDHVGVPVDVVSYPLP